MEQQKTQNSQHNIEVEEQRELTLPNFNTYYEATAMKTMQQWWNNKHIYQNNRELLQMVHKNWISKFKKINLDTAAFTKTNLNWIMEQNVRHKTMKLLEKTQMCWAWCMMMTS